ncbi:MAG: DUF2117 domain-containing protein, partial [Methanosarcinaceae archaeon]|nr:DUF2117 domain-containing protein [Methanosarcinaceae archaeon]
MKIGVVIHGPEVIDSGQAKQILDKLSELGKVRASLGGTMGKTAILDAGLEELIDIESSLKPSACIELFFEKHDLICLLNTGKTPETGQIFGGMVATRLRAREKKPLLQIESPGSPDGKVIPLNEKGKAFVESISGLLGLSAGDHPSLSPTRPLKKKNSTEAEPGLKPGKKRLVREVSGVFPGENVLVNGIVIGKAEASEVRIISEAGFITGLEGGSIKEHGLEKLHQYEARVPLDLEKAWVKSGNIRRSLSASGKTGKTGDPLKRAVRPSPPPGNKASDKGSGGKVVLIDHAAERCFELAGGADFAVTVGDDTTAIAGDILSRLGIPILGITDGDCDEVAEYTEVFPGSIVICLRPGKDDVVGRRLKNKYFNGDTAAYFEDIPTLKKEILEM